jgi:hypothetical protein
MTLHTTNSNTRTAGQRGAGMRACLSTQCVRPHKPSCRAQARALACRHKQGHGSDAQEDQDLAACKLLHVTTLQVARTWAHRVECRGGGGVTNPVMLKLETPPPPAAGRAQQGEEVQACRGRARHKTQASRTAGIGLITLAAHAHPPTHVHRVPPAPHGRSKHAAGNHTLTVTPARCCVLRTAEPQREETRRGARWCASAAPCCCDSLHNHTHAHAHTHQSAPRGLGMPAHCTGGC